jgi:transcription elongation factor GreA
MADKNTKAKKQKSPVKAKGDDTSNKVAATSGVSGQDSKVTFLTKEGLELLKSELEYLENVKRKEIAGRIKEAVSYGDLSENSEYEEAKNEQAFVEGRILVLNEQIKYAQIIDDEAAHSQSKKQMTVQLGNKVKLKALSGKSAGMVFEYSIVGTTEADPLNGKISNESPVGIALLNAKVGDKIDIKAPVGIVTYQILSIS